MPDITRYPLAVFVLSFLMLWLAARLGELLHGKQDPVPGEARGDFEIVLAATLTLLGLVIGFTFSMAINRYDQRKNYEEGEASAIGTEYVRANLLPAADAARVQSLLKLYLQQRVQFYLAHDPEELSRANAATAALQGQLWSAVVPTAAAQPTPIVGLAVAGMNDVLSSQGYAQAAYWNRIPVPAWLLMGAIALCCSALLGYGSRSTKAGAKLLLVLPLVVSIAFALIADIDAPRHGFITVRPQNLDSLVESLRAP